MKKAIALGGGGARGLAHLGVLRVFEENGIKFDIIAGTSMGSVIGALYAVEQDVDKIQKTLKDYLFNKMFSKLNMEKLQGDGSVSSAKKLIRKAREFVKYGTSDETNSFFANSMLEEMINAILPDIDIKDTKIPLVCVATDITNGREKIFTKGPLRKIVLASTSIPGVFPPVNIDGVWYTDGAHVNVTPVSVARLMGADFIVASDVKSKLKIMDAVPVKSRDMMNRCNFIAGHLFYEMLIKEANVVLEPNIKQISWSEFNKFNLMVNEGEKEARTKMPSVLKEIEKIKSPAVRCGRFFRRFFKCGKSFKAAIY